MTPQSPARNRPPVFPRTTAPILQQDKNIRFQGEALVVMVFIIVIFSVMSCILFISRKKKTDTQNAAHDVTNP